MRVHGLNAGAVWFDRKMAWQDTKHVYFSQE